jgi:hypothetical protein
MVNFLVMDRLSRYNAILDRTALNELKAVTLTPFLRMKFPPKKDLGSKKVIRGWPWNARAQA